MIRTPASPMFLAVALAGSALGAAGCTPEGSGGGGSAADGNAFSDAESRALEQKFDTGWVSSLDAVEVELDFEADLDPAAGFWDAKAPLKLGQFALTYLRNNSNVFIQSLAEDYANGSNSVEWLVDGAWKRGDDPAVLVARPTHYRLRGVSAVVLEPDQSDDALLGTTYEAVVPKRASKLFSEAGDDCGSGHGSIEVSQSVYWYAWTPEKATCSDELKQTISLTVSKVLPRAGATYPEYNRLLEDGRIDVVVFFGQVGHEELDETDYAFPLIKKFSAQLEAANFRKAAQAPRGIRYLRDQDGVQVVVDIYTPFEFAGLSDYANVGNFDEAVRTHEIIVWNGHSVLGGSDFWARPEIYEGDAARKYQIFLYNGCLGYEYYVNPILEGKKSWDNVDLVTNTLETPFSIVVDETSAPLGLIIGGAANGGTTSWQTILSKMNDIAGWGGYYGASGVRTNAFTPPL
jgi:hypothetical protein